MDTHRCQALAERLHPLLLQQVGMGLDSARMLSDPLYARDVLLVCAAHPGTELAALAWEFREAAAPARPPPTARAAPRRSEAERRQNPRRHHGTGPADGEDQTLMRVVNPGEADAERDARHDSASEAPSESAHDSQAAAGSTRSARSRFSLSRFGASIFGGSLFDRSLFGSPKADPVTDFGDESFLAPPQVQPPRGATGQAGSGAGAPKRARWFGR